MTQTLMEMATVFVVARIRAGPCPPDVIARLLRTTHATLFDLSRQEAAQKPKKQADATPSESLAALGNASTFSGELSGMREVTPSAVESPSGLTWADPESLQTEMGYPPGAAIECALSHPTPSAQGQRAERGPVSGRLACPTTPTDGMSQVSGRLVDPARGTMVIGAARRRVDDPLPGENELMRDSRRRSKSPRERTYSSQLASVTTRVRPDASCQAIEPA